MSLGMKKNPQYDKDDDQNNLIWDGRFGAPSIDWRDFIVINFLENIFLRIIPFRWLKYTRLANILDIAGLTFSALSKNSSNSATIPSSLLSFAFRSCLRVTGISNFSDWSRSQPVRDWLRNVSRKSKLLAAEFSRSGHSEPANSGNRVQFARTSRARVLPHTWRHYSSSITLKRQTDSFEKQKNSVKW